MSKWKKLSGKVVYETPWFYINRDQVIDPSGKQTVYSTFNFSNDPVHIVAMDAKHNIYLVQQYRYPVGATTWELPAGHTEGQSAIAAAKRELLEETGLKAKKLEKVADYIMCPGVSGSRMQLVFAHDVQRVDDGLDQVDGIIAMQKCSPAQTERMIKQGRVKDALSIAGLYIAFGYLASKGVK